MSDTDADSKLNRYRSWFYAAALYNSVWGVTVILFPNLLFDLIGMNRPIPQALWQVVGMLVLVYAPAYWWAARRPAYFRHLILIGFLGKVFGIVGYVVAVGTGRLPLSFGWVILLNDVIWIVPFATFLRDASRYHGGARALVLGE